MRLFHDPPLSGPVNMARDEALLVGVGDRRSPPTLRLYQWNPPTISLGYFQKHADYEALEPPARGLPVVRRLTGGGAILHDLEITYSLTIPIDHPLAVAPNRLYGLAQQAVVRAMNEIGVEAEPCPETDDSTPTRGPFFCFARRHRYDVLLEGKKLAGSAQRRTKTAVLQHGSIVFGNRFPQQPTADWNVRHSFDLDAFRGLFGIYWAQITSVGLVDADWTEEELSMTEKFVEKYAGAAWNIHGRLSNETE